MAKVRRQTNILRKVAVEICGIYDGAEGMFSSIVVACKGFYLELLG